MPGRRPRQGVRRPPPPCRTPPRPGATGSEGRARRYNGAVSTAARVPALAWQPSLWAAGSPAVDPGFAGLERVQLDADSWVDSCQGWLRGSDRAFEELLGTVAWGQRRRWMYDRHVAEPRLTSWHKAADLAVDAQAWLGEARAALAEHYGVEMDSVGMNLYRDGTDSVAWHRDRIPAEVTHPLVALVSLGQPRTFLVRPFGGGRSMAFRLGGGDLLVTGGQTQRRFEHSVPKVKSAGPRMSLAFRQMIA
jgi:alkylated DNA repair dioxygenase AlkB